MHFMREMGNIVTEKLFLIIFRFLFIKINKYSFFSIFQVVHNCCAMMKRLWNKFNSNQKTAPITKKINTNTKMEGLPGLNVPKSFSGLLSFSRESVSASLSRAEASLGLTNNLRNVPNTSNATAASHSEYKLLNGPSINDLTHLGVRCGDLLMLKADFTPYKPIL